MGIKSVLKSFKGVWRLKRTFDRSGVLLGSAQGTAWFYPRKPMKDVFKGFSDEERLNTRCLGATDITGFSSNEVMEESLEVSGEAVLHYQEACTFTNATGHCLAAHREYFYACEADKVIKKYFSQGGSPRGLFYQLTFESPETVDNVLIARGEHLCARDLYRATHRYTYRDSQTNPGTKTLESIELDYDVEGPEESYKAKTLFLRQP